MPDYDLSRLSPRSFEQLVQALAGRVFGPGLVVFGDGPDGGREATFEGEVAYHKDGQPWKGYCVIQAKFRQKSQNSPADAQWALAQLKEEFSSYNRDGKDRRRPDYYIFATNVVLTPVQTSGGKDQVYNYLQQQSLRDFGVWDYDAIRVMLDADAEIRTAYSAWVTPGDVLAAVLEILKPQNADFRSTITNYLQKELLGDQYVDLEQAGHNAEDKIPLSRVFVDLPANDEPVGERDKSLKEAPDTGIVRQILDAATWKLDPVSIRGLQKNGTSFSPVPGRHVIIGGPGQGKTTVGQYLCQLYRASFLSSLEPASLSPEVQSVVSVFRATCEAEQINLPSARRFPIRIVLNEFASTLARKEDGVTSLFSYILSRIRKRTNHQVSETDLRTWLSLYPWFVVLDGLDEVPASTNRDETLAAVEEFWVDASQLNSDLCVLATTRPQGYNKDFSPRFYRHQWLIPLHVDDSLKYAARLVESKYGDNAAQKEKILARLKRASRNEATFRLMRSPLQVTIMAALVDRTGTPPGERWNLFSQYYKVIYEREMERDIPAAQILRGYKPDVDAIHQRVGLALQIESERAGGTDARLSKHALSQIVSDRLEEEGHSEETRSSLTDQIMDAAMQRLVFLVGVQADSVGFEIRSLQEFMAAEGLMQGSDEDIRNRLEAIAKATNWRNVFLFAVGRCFMERQYLREAIFALCAGINEDPDDELAATALLGSHLALEILEDGPARRQPKYAQMFVRLALRILDLPPHEVHARLGAVYHSDLEMVYREEVARRIMLPGHAGAWKTLLELSGAGLKWAIQMVREQWPSDPHLHAVVLEFVKPSDTNNADLYLKTLAELPPQELGKWEWLGRWDRLFNPVPDWAAALSSVISIPRMNAEVDFSRGSRSLFTLRYAPIESESHVLWRSLRSMPCHGGRRFIIEAVDDFVSTPDAFTLAQKLEAFSSLDLDEIMVFAPGMPWPLSGCIHAVSDSGELRVLAQRAREGALGDREDWMVAEKRWTTNGIQIDDVMSADGGQWPFSSHIGGEGFPFSIGYMSISHSPELLPILQVAMKLHKQVRYDALKEKVGDWCAFLLRICLEQRGIETLDINVRDALELFKRRSVELQTIIQLRRFLPQQWCSLVNEIGLTADEIFRYGDLRGGSTGQAALFDCVSKEPDATGALRVLTYFPPTETPHSEWLLNALPSVGVGEVVEEARVYLRLCSKDWLGKEPAEFGRSVARVIQRRRDMVEWVTQRLRQEGNEQQAAAFITGMLSLIEEKEKYPRGAMIEAVNILLRRRISSIAEHGHWTRLHLPAKLGAWLGTAMGKQ